jgi:tRNA U55 pseudouridine synthase TruB
LGSGAHLATLRRTEAGGFSEADAVALADVSEQNLRPIGDAVSFLPRLEATDEAEKLVANGRPLPLDLLGNSSSDEGTIAIVRDDRLLALYRKEKDTLKAEMVVAQ